VIWAKFLKDPPRKLIKEVRCFGFIMAFFGRDTDQSYVYSIHIEDGCANHEAMKRAVQNARAYDASWK
jgi:hypothetical protein